MKKLICAAVVAGSMFAMAEEAAPTAEAKVPAVSTQQREKLREMIAKRRAEMVAKKLEIVKKYVPEEDKAKALLAELQAAEKAARRPRPASRPLPRAKKAPEGEK